ncbi:bacteriophage lysis protein [Lelliottia amnigena]|nr:bacteriophage lysis protein [Lelliottia amnigena]
MLNQKDMNETARAVFNELSERPATAGEIAQNTHLTRERCQLILTQLVMAGLHVNANCPANGTTSTGGMGDASGSRLTDAAERDYFTLRERIITVTKQVGYLQEYIKEQCIK